MSLRPQVIARFNSPLSGEIRVVKGWGVCHLSTDSIQQSGGIVTEIWSQALKKSQSDRRWLVLGVAGGSVLKLISRKYNPRRLVGVDIDPVIVDVGKQYFGLSQIPHLELVIADAKEYLSRSRPEVFDYLLVDLFCDVSPPAFVYTRQFLRHAKSVAGTVFVNHLYDTPKHREKAHEIAETFTKLGYTPAIKKVLANAVIIC